MSENLDFLINFKGELLELLGNIDKMIKVEKKDLGIHSDSDSDSDSDETYTVAGSDSD